MATGTIYAVVPAVVAVVGFYFIDTNYAKELIRGISAPNQNILAEVKEQLKNLQKPKVTPQRDGLHCFETIFQLYSFRLPQSSVAKVKDYTICAVILASGMFSN